MSHHCHAFTCSTPCRPEYLMCPRHWATVPPAVKQRVWSTYRRGQCADKKPSEAWCRAADEAVAHVARLEGRAVPETLTFLWAFHSDVVRRERPPGWSARESLRQSAADARARRAGPW